MSLVKSTPYKLQTSISSSYFHSFSFTTTNASQHTRALTPKVKPEDCYLSVIVAFMNPQSCGEIRLRSSDPNEPPVTSPNFLSDLFDRRNAIESVRATLELLEQPQLTKDTLSLAAGPEGREDEDIYVSYHKISIHLRKIL